MKIGAISVVCAFSAMILFPALALADPSSCVAKRDDKERLACFDEAFRNVPQPTPGTTATVADIFADFGEMQGKQVEVSGMLLMIGGNAFLYARRGELSGLFVDIKRLPKDQRHTIFEKCGSGCDVTVFGKVDRVMMSPGIDIDNVRLQ